MFVAIHNQAQLRVDLTIAAYLLAMVLCVVIAQRGERLGLALLALLSLAWFGIDAPLGEGDVLIVLVRHHMGITEADIFGIVGLIVAIALAGRRRGNRRRRRHE